MEYSFKEKDFKLLKKVILNLYLNKGLTNEVLELSILADKLFNQYNNF